MRPGWLVVFAKAPAAGRVKTRFTPPLTPAEAAVLYRCLLDDVLEVSGAAAASLDLDAVLAVDAASEVATLTAQAPRGFRGIAQGHGALGDRMARAAHQAVAAGAPCVFLRGSDSPCMAEATLAAAVGALSRVDLVVCPDRDGGYNLVGVRAQALSSSVLGQLFDHPMSVPTVLRDTLARAERLGLATHQLPTGFDLDRFEDLAWLAAVRHTSASDLCRRTLAFLDEHGLWPPGSDPVATRSAANGGLGNSRER